MSILIKGAEMPKSCWECEVGSASQLDNNTCPFYAMEGQEQENYQNKIANGCPISYVPPHGDLIDREELQHIIGQFSLNWEYGQGVSDCWDALLDAPTVIEAEEET